MCGFCGFTGDIADRENIIIGMMNKIIHRGPDSAGTHSDEDVTMRSEERRVGKECRSRWSPYH